MPLVYRELHRMARRYMANERAEHTLSPTALVNEAYLRLLGSKPPSWQDRVHFFGVAAQVTRRILVDWARARQAHKRGGTAFLPELQEAFATAGGKSIDLLAVDDALKALSALDGRKSQVVELRFFRRAKCCGNCGGAEGFNRDRAA